MQELQEIFKEQKSFFESGQTLNKDFRIEILKNLKNTIKKNEENILIALNKDLGKSNFEAYITEVSMIYEEINLQIKNIKKWSKRKKVKSPLVQFPSKSYIYSEPYGIVLIIGPFNYPFQLMISPMIGAIAAGNTVLIKPSEATLNTCNVIKLIIKEVFSREYVAYINPEKGKGVVENLLKLNLDYIFFTGSKFVGKIIMKEAAKNLIPVTLELGGKSPCIVNETAKIEIAARRIIWGKLLNSGQTCVAPDYIYVHKNIKDKFLKALVDEIKTQYGNVEKSKYYPRIVNENSLSRIISYINKDKIYFGGNYIQEKLYIEPTILKDITWNDKIMQQEIFGPIIPVLDFNNIDDVIKEVNSKSKPLALYYFGEDKNTIDKVLSETSSGGVTINDTIVHVSSPYLPFGGVGQSGLGQYHGKASFDLFSHKKSVMKRGTWLDLKIRYAPFNNKLKLIKKLMR
ncbi:aldehyde dehydrogenase [Clostridium tarantellae]|uniref:Aldehyde dehydrogenase n=1 Tax=Clostridium tarantellae TaxID=39493 RepID=A0A6I1MP10_9CLOT|nr:aldehyde dehydrogenase [Clostridium tarantellae]MPQ43857.1 aldehyde dehydrogenase family protein [Clostridium tarantellae]